MSQEKKNKSVKSDGDGAGERKEDRSGGRRIT